MALHTINISCHHVMSINKFGMISSHNAMTLGNYTATHRQSLCPSVCVTIATGKIPTANKYSNYFTVILFTSLR